MKTWYIHDITAISLLLSFCSCEQEYNITFHEDKTTWIDAVKHCYDNDGVLYNNKDDIKNVTWGCHKIHDITTKTKFKVPRINQTECQSLCSGTEYFAVKDDTCVCLLLGDLKDKLPNNSCSCDECYKVIRHNKTNVAMSCKDETKCLCIYAACTGKVLSLTPGNCGLPFIVECELPNLLLSFRCLKLTKQTDTEEYGACDKENVLPYFCKIDNKQTNKVISENNNTGVLAGSVTLVLLTRFKASQSKSQNIDQKTNQSTTETNSDGPKTGLKKGNRPLPIPFIGKMSEEDENTYCRIASVYVEEPTNNFSNLCYDEIIFKSDTNSSNIHYKENTIPVENTEDDENVYSRIVSAVFDEQKQTVADSGNNDSYKMEENKSNP
ncbi:unnamed protein product [Mytilus edulis]|uniref:Uncharacterized protein n=1 Tax=Mytilus edulis TaxID=6550 RepID=A0A8S3T7Q1_MYTED|nr:unnamed protein product [Mytilus edulis]